MSTNMNTCFEGPSIRDNYGRRVGVVTSLGMLAALVGLATACGEPGPIDAGDAVVDGAVIASLAEARLACAESCDAIEPAEDCASPGRLELQAEQCRESCRTQLDNARQCAPQGRVMWECLRDAAWLCRMADGYAEPYPGSCQVEGEELRDCILAGG